MSNPEIPSTTFIRGQTSVTSALHNQNQTKG